MGIGCGYSAIRDWSAVMNTPIYMSKLTFQGSKNNIIAGSRESFEEIAKRSVEKIRERYGELGIVPDKDDVLDVAVSFDGSWHRPGNSSHNGLGVVIELLTGLPIDFQVLYNFCHQCYKSPEKDDPNYAEWISNHTAKCSKNYDGSANSMEQHCALLICRGLLLSMVLDTLVCYVMVTVSHIIILLKERFMAKMFQSIKMSV